MNGLLKIISDVSKNGKIYIYGDGEVGRLTRIFLHEQGIEIEGFITTNAPKSDSILGIPVFAINKGVISENATVMICVRQAWRSEIYNKLVSYGVDNIFIVDDVIRKLMEDEVTFADELEDDTKYINVLLYHRVGQMTTPYSIVVEKLNFENQLKYICSNYNLLNCNEEWNNIRKKSVALTFDDGYVDFYSTVYPLLKKYNVPATVFVATKGIDNECEFWWDELEHIFRTKHLPYILHTTKRDFKTNEYENRASLILDIRNAIIENTYDMRDREIAYLKQQINPNLTNRKLYRTMTTEEIRTIAKDPLITIGAHTVNHILCDQENADIQYNEIYESKKKLETIIDKEIDLFAYPNGNVGKDTRDILAKLEFKRAFTCEHACIECLEFDTRFDIPRSVVLNWDSSELNRRFRGTWQTSKNI